MSSSTTRDQTAERDKDRATQNPQATPALSTTLGGEGSGGVLASLHQSIGNTAIGRLMSGLGDGEPLEPGIRGRLERAFGTDLRRVRVHADAPGAAALNAEAFTIGWDIHVDPAVYRPHRPEGEGLLSHEVAHAVQQSGAAPGAAIEGAAPAVEAEASRAAADLTQGRAPRVSAAPIAIARQGRDGWRTLHRDLTTRYSGLSGAIDWTAFDPPLDAVARDWLADEGVYSTSVTPASVLAGLRQRIVEIYNNQPFEEGDVLTYHLSLKVHSDYSPALEVTLVRTRHAESHPQTEAEQAYIREKKKGLAAERAKNASEAAYRQLYRGEKNSVFVTEAEYQAELRRLPRLVRDLRGDIDWTQAEQKAFWQELGTTGRFAGKYGHAMEGLGYEGPPWSRLAELYESARSDLRHAEEMLDEADAVRAAFRIETSAKELLEAEGVWDNWVQDAARGAGTTVGGLTWIKDKSRTAVMLMSMFLPGSSVAWGAARGALWVGGLRAAQETAEVVEDVLIGFDEDINWRQRLWDVGIETVVSFVSGLAAGAMAKALIGGWGAYMSRGLSEAALAEAGLTREAFVTGWQHYLTNYFGSTASTPVSTVSGYLLTRLRNLVEKGPEKQSPRSLTDQILADLEVAARDNLVFALLPFAGRGRGRGGGGEGEGGAGGDAGGNGRGPSGTLLGMGPPGPEPAAVRQTLPGMGEAAPEPAAVPQTLPGVGPEPPAPAPREATTPGAEPEPPAAAPRPVAAGEGVAGAAAARPTVVRSINDVTEARRLIVEHVKSGGSIQGAYDAAMYAQEWQQLRGGEPTAPPAYLRSDGLLRFDANRVGNGAEIPGLVEAVAQQAARPAPRRAPSPAEVAPTDPGAQAAPAATGEAPARSVPEFIQRQGVGDLFKHVFQNRVIERAASRRAGAAAYDRQALIQIHDQIDAMIRSGEPFEKIVDLAIEKFGADVASQAYNDAVANPVFQGPPAARAPAGQPAPAANRPPMSADEAALRRADTQPVGMARGDAGAGPARRAVPKPPVQSRPGAATRPGYQPLNEVAPAGRGARRLRPVEGAGRLRPDEAARTLRREEGARTLRPDEAAPTLRPDEAARPGVGPAGRRLEPLTEAQALDYGRRGAAAAPEGHQYAEISDWDAYVLRWQRSGGTGEPPDFGFTDYGQTPPAVLIYVSGLGGQ